MDVKTKTLIMWIVVLEIILIMGIWTIDIGTSAMNVQQAINGGTIVATNGWWQRNPTQQYHIGIFTVILASISQTALFLAWMFKEQTT